MMKKLLTILFAFALFSAYALGQTATAVSHIMPASATYYEYTPTQWIGGDTTVATYAGYDTLYFEILTNKNTQVVCNARVEVEAREGSADTYDMDLQGKIFENGTYAAIIEGATKVATFELIDTTGVYAKPAKYYRYYRGIVNNDDKHAKTDSLIIGKIIFKLYER